MKQLNSRWYRTQKMSDTVWCISDNGFDLMYLIEGKEYALLVDTGFGTGDLPALCGTLTSREIILVLTHAHPDHCMGAGQFESVNLCADDMLMLLQLHKYRKRKTMVHSLFSSADIKYESAYIEQWMRSGIRAMTEVYDGQLFDLGGRKIRVIMTPGHTKGSICLLDEMEGRLFSGDTVVNCNHLLHLQESADLQTFHQSLLHLKTFETEFCTIHPGHERAPLEKEKLQELTNGVESILSGKIVGVKTESMGEAAVRYRFGKENSLLYKPVNPI